MKLQTLIKNFSSIWHANGCRDFYTFRKGGFFLQSQIYGTLYLLFSMVQD